MVWLVKAEEVADREVVPCRRRSCSVVHELLFPARPGSSWRRSNASLMDRQSRRCRQPRAAGGVRPVVGGALRLGLGTPGGRARMRPRRLADRDRGWVGARVVGAAFAVGGSARGASGGCRRRLRAPSSRTRLVVHRSYRRRRVAASWARHCRAAGRRRSARPRRGADPQNRVEPQVAIEPTTFASRGA